MTVLVQKVADSTTAAVLGTQKSRAEVELGVTAVNKAQQALDNLVIAAECTTDNVNNIVRITNEEVQAFTKIVQLINSLAQGDG